MIDFTQQQNQHPMLRLFPLMSAEELNALAQDIKQNGLRDPLIYIRADGDGPELLIDGQNRAAACKILGAQIGYGYPHLEQKYFNDDEDLLRFILSKNLHRRQLSAVDRAKIVLAASEMITKIQAEAKERQQAALEKANAERKALADAKKVVEKNPELAEQFIRNETEPVVTVAEQPPVNGRTVKALATMGKVGTTVMSQLMSVQKNAPELYETIGKEISLERAAEQAAEIARERKRKERESIAKSEPKRAPKPKPAREFGIWKVGAVVLGTVECHGDHTRSFTMPLLFEVKEVKKAFAICKEVSGKFYTAELEIPFRMQESSGEHDRTSLKVIRTATDADSDMVTSTWATVENWAQIKTVTPPSTLAPVKEVIAASGKKRLTQELKEQLLADHATSEYTQAQLATKYGVSQPSVSNLLRAAKVQK